LAKSELSIINTPNLSDKLPAEAFTWFLLSVANNHNNPESAKYSDKKKKKNRII
jgi:hypothetical protein